jgi:hypothetical protein
MITVAPARYDVIARIRVRIARQYNNAFTDCRKSRGQGEGKPQATFQTVKEYCDHRLNIPQSPENPISVDSAFQTYFLLSLETMQSCLDAFFEQKYPIMPIIDRHQMSASLLHLQNSPSQYSLVCARLYHMKGTPSRSLHYRSH